MKDQGREVELRIRDTIRAIAAFVGRAPHRLDLFAEDFDLISRGQRRLHRWDVRIMRGPSREVYSVGAIRR
jgi:hypothetical protein